VRHRHFGKSSGPAKGNPCILCGSGRPKDQHQQDRPGKGDMGCQSDKHEVPTKKIEEFFLDGFTQFFRFEFREF
jgi:hypothetical protein